MDMESTTCVQWDHVTGNDYPLFLLFSVCGLFLTLKHQKAVVQRKTLQLLMGPDYDKIKTGQNPEATRQIQQALSRKFRLQELHVYHRDFFDTSIFPKLESVCKLQGSKLRKEYLKIRDNTASETSSEEMRKSIMYTQAHIYHVYKH